MLYILYCRDDPSVSHAIRSAHKDAHLAYLARHTDLIVIGGAMLAEDGQTRVGSTLILNVDRREQAEQFSLNEPFRQAGLYASVTITRMRRAQWFPEHAPKTVEGQ
ncbi:MULTISPECIES: YciI family protein [Pandoraea]|uniref:YciI family protein n=1 Tax=Pandoraea TaxID=93217 RepID=UPI001F5E2A2D|nr:MULTISPECIES: YciI family protein [Pandoraea]